MYSIEPRSNYSSKREFDYVSRSLDRSMLHGVSLNQSTSPDPKPNKDHRASKNSTPEPNQVYYMQPRRNRPFLDYDPQSFNFLDPEPLQFSRKSYNNNDSQGNLQVTNNPKHRETPDSFSNSPGPGYSTKLKSFHANLSYDEQKTIRERQKEEWRKALQEQMKQRQEAKEREKKNKIEREKIEEAKLNSEINELRDKYKREILYEKGYSNNMHYEPKERQQPKQYKELQREPQKESYKELPKEPHRELHREPQKEPTRVTQSSSKKLIHNYKDVDSWQAKVDYQAQQSSLENIISRLKEEARNAEFQRLEAMKELDKLKQNVESRSFVLRSPEPMYYRPPITPPKRNFSTDSKFIPLTNAGHSIINQSYKPKVSSNYSKIEDSDTKSQIARLDQLLVMLSSS